MKTALTIAVVFALSLGLGLAQAATINVPGDYGTIQAAITAADPSDTIQVAAGVYEENLTVEKSLTITGAGRDTTTIAAVAPPAGYTAVPGIRISASSVSISNFTIDGRTSTQESPGYSGAAVYAVAPSGETYSNINVSDCKFSYIGGVYLTRIDGFEIADNIAQRESRLGWYDPAGVVPGSMVDRPAGGNIAEIWHSTNGTVQNNSGYSPSVTIFDYSTSNVQYVGNEIACPSSPLAGDDGITDAGLSVQSSTSVLVEDNVFSGLQGAYPYSGYTHGKAGAGLYFNCATGSVTGNQFDGNTVGVKVRYLTGYAGDVVAVNSNTFAGNSFSVLNSLFQNDGGWKYFTAEVTVDATSNYWGSPDGPTVVNVPDAGTTQDLWDLMGDAGFPENAVSDMVNFADYLASDPSFPVINVTKGTGHTTIQDAVTNADAGDEIHVAAGTYEENVTIPASKPNLKLLGASNSDTTISIASGIAIRTSAPATIKGFCITGPARGTGTAIKIESATSSGTETEPGVIEDNRIENVNYGVQHGDWNVVHWQFKNNVFDNLRIGIGLENMSYAVVTGNSFDDYKEGLSMGWGDDTAHNLTITDNMFLGSGGFPDDLAAIVLSAATHDVTLTNNTITASIVGVLVVTANTPSLANVIVANNSITGNTAGIVNNSTVTLNATLNYWGDPDGPIVNTKGGDTISGDVEYDPWWADEAMTILATNANVLNVTKSTTHATIQDAVTNADSGNVIQVAAGTYQENLNINKGMLIKGADAANPPLIDLPDGDNAGVVITASDVTLEDLDIRKSDAEGYSNALVSVNRGGGWPTFTIAHSNITFRNVNFIGGRRGMLATAENLSVENCTFDGQTRDAIYLNAVSGTTNIIGNTFTGSTDSKKAIVFEFFSDGDPAVSGTVNITGNTSTGKRNFLLYNQYKELGTKVEINVTGNTISAPGDVAIEVFDVSAWGGDPAYGTKFSAFNVNSNNFLSIPSGMYAVSNASDDVVVDALNCYWGHPSGPSGGAIDPISGAVANGLGAKVSDNVHFALTDVQDPDYPGYLGSPTGNDTIWLNVAEDSLYVQPGETVTVEANIANLSQAIMAAQAMLSYGSSQLGSPVVVTPGSGWENLDSNVSTAGEIDLLIGLAVGATASDDDSTLAELTFTAGVEGTTTVGFRADVLPQYVTILVSGAAQAVQPNKIASQTITVDDTDPVDLLLAADPATWTNSNSVTLTFSATDALAGIDYLTLTVAGFDGGEGVGAEFEAESPYILDVSALADGEPQVTMTAYDKAGKWASTSINLQLDKTDPTISIVSIEQNGVDITGGTALVGDVVITVQASDATSDLDPAIPVVTANGNALTGTANGDFTYTYVVSTTSVNELVTIVATATDEAGNTAEDTASFTVNKNQLLVTVQLEGFIGSSVDRDVVFVATDAGDNELCRWTETLTYTGSDTASVTLTNVPGTIANLSAKTAWHLRSRVEGVSLSGDGQGAVSFTGEDMLLGGDLTSSNYINILDWAVLRTYWMTANPTADIDGDGEVKTLDYNILRGNWFESGDAE